MSRSSETVGAYFGTDSVCELQVDAISGTVRAFDPGGKLPTRFVNSTAKQLGAFIVAYGRYCADARAARDEADTDTIVEGLRRTLVALDPAATADPENWWSLVLEQVNDGLL